jgi:cell division protein FtsW
MLAILAFTRPYVKDRLMTFMNPESDPLGSSYQIQQSLIAVGSGGVFGRGFGQSIQKFDYLPEAIGDSIFAVYAEEFGFFGTCILVLGFVVFCLRGYKVASRADDTFGSLLVVGIVTLLTVQAFLNIGAMIALAPLSGLTLPFISHGGTSLLATLAGIGIVLNVSRYQSRKGTL